MEAVEKIQDLSQNHMEYQSQEWSLHSRGEILWCVLKREDVYPSWKSTRATKCSHWNIEHVPTYGQIQIRQYLATAPCTWTMCGGIGKVFFNKGRYKRSFHTCKLEFSNSNLNFCILLDSQLCNISVTYIDSSRKLYRSHSPLNFNWRLVQSHEI